MASSGHPNGPASQQNQQSQQHAHLASAPLSSYQQSHDSPQSAFNTHSPHSGSKPTRILACVLCQHRKIKCDRTFPCANCIKVFPFCYICYICYIFFFFLFLSTSTRLIHSNANVRQMSLVHPARLRPHENADGQTRTSRNASPDAKSCSRCMPRPSPTMISP